MMVMIFAGRLFGQIDISLCKILPRRLKSLFFERHIKGGGGLTQCILIGIWSPLMLAGFANCMYMDMFIYGLRGFPVRSVYTFRGYVVHTDPKGHQQAV